MRGRLLVTQRKPWAPLMRSIASLALTLLLTPTFASATSCGRRESVTQTFASSKHIFSAYVEEIHTGSGFGRDNAQLAKLRVLQVWKGNLNSGDVVSASAEDSIYFISDGFVPALSSSILVYTSGEQPFALQTCSRTAYLDSGADDISLLNKLSKKSANPAKH